PRLKLELGIFDRRVDLIREGYDVAVRVGAISDTGLVARKLAELPLVLVASPDYIARQGAPRSVDDLRQHACMRYVLAGRPMCGGGVTARHWSPAVRWTATMGTLFAWQRFTVRASSICCAPP